MSWGAQTGGAPGRSSRFHVVKQGRERALRRRRRRRRRRILLLRRQILLLLQQDICPSAAQDLVKSGSEPSIIPSIRRRTGLPQRETLSTSSYASRGDESELPLSRRAPRSTGRKGFGDPRLHGAILSWVPHEPQVCVKTARISWGDETAVSALRRRLPRWRAERPARRMTAPSPAPPPVSSAPSHPSGSPLAPDLGSHRPLPRPRRRGRR
jgi:hypothetical protein